MNSSTMLFRHAKKIDHIAIAVKNLEESVTFYKDVLGFELIERRTTIGKSTGMVSAVIKLGSIKFVLLEGTNPDSQISRYIEHYGPGVQHIAIETDAISKVSEDLTKRGFEFDTGIIKCRTLAQIFSKRDPDSGIMIELIEKTGSDDFVEENVQRLFEQLEKSSSF